jgi:hypothetical protein
VASLDGLAEVFDGAYGVAASDNLTARLVEVLQSRRLTRRKGREILHIRAIETGLPQVPNPTENLSDRLCWGSGALLPGAADVSKIFTNGNQVFSSVKLNQALIVLAWLLPRRTSLLP